MQELVTIKLSVQEVYLLLNFSLCLVRV